MSNSYELFVRSQGGGYCVTIGESTFSRVLETGSDVVVADRYFEPLLRATEVPVVYVDADEKHKTLVGAEELIIGCFEAGARRGSRLLAIGGGVVQDLATLVSSLYMRGLPWSYAPTTLMAMADSCVGGKSSINAGSVKNLVGNIYPPASITIDPMFLKTLSVEDLVGGFSEAVKICFCRGSSSFEDHLDHFGAFEQSSDHAAALLHHVLSAKQWFVEVDEFDKKERRLLNFGHTFGHALESATTFSVSHGVGVAVGMLCAVNFAMTRTALGDGARLLAAHTRHLLERVPELGPRLRELDIVAFERSFRGDKKHRDGEFRLILPARQGGVEEVGIPAGEIEMGAVLDALMQSVSEVAG
ncbi:MAG TPA: 3-dehydroquinate synthase family protein [Acidimicrobiales bacterium]|nr:3-dehydroquinate synthase family protein [Acidimicrobiales bacterium]